ncbi:MAG TPA: efflux RND transporter periplasmic adaptor subunit [Candidatus Latescibacteria bacterium]|nr:efflux RND transporter periplasmic adaptor subunit [Candidatus Latescibacterota bacterium]
MKKVLAIAILLALGGGAAYWSFSREKKPQGPPFKTFPVERGDIVVKVTESGRVEPVTSVEVKSEMAGEVKKLFVEEGDTVVVGEPLALIQQESSQAQQVAQARASLERARLDLERARRDLERQRALYERGFIAKKEVEDAEEAYRKAEIQYDLARRQLWLVLGGRGSVPEQALEDTSLETIVIKAPISGVVTSLKVEEGEMITSGTRAYMGGGTTLMTIADLSKMVVKVDINEVDVTKVRLGQEVRIGFDAIRGKVYHGRVKKIAPAGVLRGNVVVYPVEVEITDLDGRIRPGMTADLDIIAGEARDVLCVPKEAVQRRRGRTGVLVLVNGRPVPRPVVTGLEDDVKVEIRSGLREGEVVVAEEEKLRPMGPPPPRRP